MNNYLYYARAIVYTPIKEDILAISNPRVDHPKTNHSKATTRPITNSRATKPRVEDIRTWHERLGHINIYTLLQLLKVEGISVSDESIRDFKSQNCKICLLSKHDRQIYRESINPRKNYDILERIHSDLGGPLPITFDGKRYYITFLDKESRFLWLKLLKQKADAYKAFKEFRVTVENNNSKHRIRELFTDNGKEYINKQFASELTKLGITKLNTPPYTKEPNGLAERINLTLMNKVRALLLGSNSPNYMWGEALIAAVYIYNRTPHSSLNKRSPYEIYYGYKPNIYTIKTWGSLAYYHTNMARPKLSPTKREAILIGYSDHGHYKLYDYTQRGIVWSRDVIILENQFRLTKATSIKDTSQALKEAFNESRYRQRDISEESDSRDTGQVPTHINEPTRANKPTRANSPNTRQYDVYRTRAYAKELASNPNHKIEVQIPTNNDVTYTIKDSILSDCLGTIANSDANYLLTTSISSEPSSYYEAINSLNKDDWLKAMKSEIDELERQDTWEIINLPPNIKPLKGRWVYKLKPINTPCLDGKDRENSPNIRYKARWVIQGFNQRLGVDFLETFASTCRTETWHLLLIIAVNKRWHIRQYDVKNAFVHAYIDTDIYTILPIGLYSDNRYKNKVCHLKKALYGLKQSPRLWHQYLANLLAKLGFKVLPYDEGVFIHKADKAIIICHVDDLLILHKDISYIYNLVNKIKASIKLEDLGQVSTFLGNDIYIDYPNQRIYINQAMYTKKLLTKYGIYDNTSKYRPVQIPGEPGVKLRKNTVQASPSDIKLYQQYIGSLLFLALKTRPDIAFPVGYTARFMANPNLDHFNAVDKIWKYLLPTTDLGLIYNCAGKNLSLKGYCDSDWANDLEQRRSTSGYIFSLSSDLGPNNPIS